MKRLLTGLFAVTIFLAAGLLFSAQPMIARSVLPGLGGSPAVWTTCMLFFQAELLAGYGYAHFVVVRLSDRAQLVLHIGLLVAAAMGPAIDLTSASANPLAEQADPTLGLLVILARSVGLSFFVVATTAPLLQRWFAGSRAHEPRDPYFLYAASNAGSLIALLAYPVWIERAFGLTRQAEFWSRGFQALLALVAVCGLVSLLGKTRIEPASVPPIRMAWSRWFGWVVLALIPSSLMLGVTSYLTTDLAAIPLLWVIPLTLYLLSFILVFSRKRTEPGRFWPRVFPWLVLPLAAAIGIPLVEPFWLILPLHLVAFFGAAMVCHGALARHRPPPSELTSFYLAMAVGGAAGGVLNAIVAPVVFNSVAEYPLAVVAACLVLAVEGQNAKGPRFAVADFLLPAIVGCLAGSLCANPGGFSNGAFGAIATMVAAGLTMLVVWTHRTRPIRFGLTIGALLIASRFASGVSGRVLLRDRSFFGVMTVTEVSEGSFHRLFHGSTLHGQQCMDPARRREPLTYFDRSGPIGQVFENFHARNGPKPCAVGVTGVGAGSLASYARAGETWTFYEIDPGVIRVARDPRYFTYLSDSLAASLDIKPGDARIELARAPDAAYDLLILDAFSSDAIPAHLLTREAVALYRRKLRPDGWLVFNISNRYLDLAPVVARLASDAGLTCRVRIDADITPEQKRQGKQGSIWAVMTAREGEIGGIRDDPRWVVPNPGADHSVWTDDSSNLLEHFRFRSPRGVAQGR